MFAVGVATTRGRTTRDSAGPGSIMGAAETRLMHEMASKARKGWAYMEHEISDMVRSTSRSLTRRKTAAAATTADDAAAAHVVPAKLCIHRLMLMLQLRVLLLTRLRSEKRSETAQSILSTSALRSTWSCSQWSVSARGTGARVD